MEYDYDELIEYLDSSVIPVKLEYIIDALGIEKEKSFKKQIHKWAEEGNSEIINWFENAKSDGVNCKERPKSIVEIKTSKNIYYTNFKPASIFESTNTKAYFGTYIAQMCDLIEEVEHVATSVENKQKSLYAEVISLMGIFVAIFSLIVINANLVQAIAEKTVQEIISICIIVNGCTVVAIFVLLLFIRYLIINKLNKKK